MLAQAAKVLAAAEKGQRLNNRVPFKDYMPALVPALPASFLGKLKLSSLRGFADVEKALRERGITDGWLPYKRRRVKTDPPNMKLDELKKLLPTETVEEKTGRYNETQKVVYVTGDVIAPDAMDEDEVEQEAFAALEATVADGAFQLGQAPAQAAPGRSGRPKRAAASRRQQPR